MKLIAGKSARHNRGSRPKDHKAPPGLAPMTHDHHDESYQRQNESCDEKTSQRRGHVMARIAVSIDQQTDQTEVFHVPPNKLWRDLAPGRIWFDVRDEIKPLGQRFRMP